MLFSFDKSTLSYSSVMGIRDDAHLSSGEYAWLGSIFSLGYLVSNLPCAIMIQKAPLSKWIVVMMSIWGVILALMAVGRNFGQLFAIRLLLGYEDQQSPYSISKTSRRRRKLLNWLSAL